MYGVVPTKRASSSTLAPLGRESTFSVNTAALPASVTTVARETRNQNVPAENSTPSAAAQAADPRAARGVVDFTLADGPACTGFDSCSLDDETSVDEPSSSCLRRAPERVGGDGDDGPAAATGSGDGPGGSGPIGGDDWFGGGADCMVRK